MDFESSITAKASDEDQIQCVGKYTMKVYTCTGIIYTSAKIISLNEG